MKKSIAMIMAAAAMTAVPLNGDACTGIAMTAKDGSRVVARTVEWGG